MIGFCVGMLLDIGFFFLSLYLTKDWLDSAAKLDATALALYTTLMIVVGFCAGAIATWAVAGRNRKLTQAELDAANARVAELEGKVVTCRVVKENDDRRMAQLVKRWEDHQDSRPRRVRETARGLSALTRGMLVRLAHDDGSLDEIGDDVCDHLLEHAGECVEVSASYVALSGFGAEVAEYVESHGLEFDEGALPG